jgi:hypothetical protein
VHESKVLSYEKQMKPSEQLVQNKILFWQATQLSIVLFLRP